MSTIELRKLLIEKIQSTEDNKLLEEAYRLLEVEINESDVFILNDAQKEAIEQGRKEIKKGEFLSDDESNRVKLNMHNQVPST